MEDQIYKEAILSFLSFFPFFFIIYKNNNNKKTIIGFEDLMLQSKLLYRVAFPLPVQLQCHIIETNNDKHIFD